MEAITRMECRLLHGYDLDFSPNKWRWKFGPALNLLLFLLLLLVILFLFLVLLLGSLLSGGLLLTLRSLRMSVLLSYLENMWMVGGCFWVKDSGSRPFLIALFLNCSFCLSASSLNS